MAGVTGDPIEAPRPIRQDDDVSAFVCGHEALDAWLKTVAMRSEGLTARTYVVCRARVVIGYYCLATGGVARIDAPGRLRRNAPDPVPVMILGRLAVTSNCKGLGLGSAMLRDAIERVVQAAEIAGCRAMLVHAIDDAAARFYARHGFVEFPPGRRAFFLPLESVRRAL